MGALRLVVILLAGCGRFGFDATPADDEDPIQPDGPPPAVDDAPLTSRCPGAPGIVCEGFEAGLGAWRMETGAGTVDVIDDAFLGAKALRATAGNGGFAYLAVDLAPVNSSPLHLRAMVRVGTTPVAPGDGVQFIRVGTEGDSGHIHLLLEQLDRPVYWQSGPMSIGASAVARGQWLCLELAVQLGDPGTFDLRIDGTPQISGTDEPVGSVEGGYAELSIGIVTTEQAQAPFTIDLDEVRLGTSPIPCD